MQVRAIDIANLLGGELVGDPNVLVYKPAKIEEGSAGAISFLGNVKYESYLYTCASSVVLVSNDFVPKTEVTATLIKVQDVYASLSVLLQHFEQAMKSKEERTISELAFIHPEAKVGPEAMVAPFAYIGKGVEIGANATIGAQVYLEADIKIGDDVQLQSGVKIHKGCQLGNRVVVKSNAVIGSDGFGFAPQEDGSYQRIPQLGIVILEDDVSVGACTVIDRATMEATLIEQGVKLDNLIQVAHNVRIGKNTVLAAQVGIAGSTSIGTQCMIGGQVGFAGHINIADNTNIQAQSGVARSVKKQNTAIWGSPAIDYAQYAKASIVFKKLPELYTKINRLEKLVENLEKKDTD